jgi:hypothetical protein
MGTRRWICELMVFSFFFSSRLRPMLQQLQTCVWTSRVRVNIEVEGTTCVSCEFRPPDAPTSKLRPARWTLCKEPSHVMWPGWPIHDVMLKQVETEGYQRQVVRWTRAAPPGSSEPIDPQSGSLRSAFRRIGRAGWGGCICGKGF